MIYLKLLPWLLLAILGYFSYHQIKANALLSAEIESANGIISAERTNAQEAANRQLARVIEEEKRDAEHQKLVTCVANKSCGFKLRFQACPPMSGTASAGSESTEAAAEPYRQFQQWNLDHRKLIRDYEGRIGDLQKELKARSVVDYCESKSTN